MPLRPFPRLHLADWPDTSFPQGSLKRPPPSDSELPSESSGYTSRYGTAAALSEKSKGKQRAVDPPDLRQGSSSARSGPSLSSGGSPLSMARRRLLPWAEGSDKDGGRVLIQPSTKSAKGVGRPVVLVVVFTRLVWMLIRLGAQAYSWGVARPS